MQNGTSALNAASRAAGEPVAYRERLSPSLKTIAASAVIAPMVALSLTPLLGAFALPVGIGVAAVLILLMVAAAPVVSVAGDELRAGRAHIAVSYLGTPEAFTADEARAARGVGIDRTGWFLLRGGANGVVRLACTDPDDPVTTWTISSRTPDRLVAAIAAAQRAARAG